MNRPKSSAPGATSRLMVREWTEDDKVPFRRLNADPRVMEHFPISALSDAAVERLIAHQRLHGFCFWAVEIRETRAFVGFVGLNIYRWQTPSSPVIEIGWRLAHEFWGKGLATEAARAALRFGFDELLLEEIVAVTASTNVRSQRVMLRLGMQCSESDNFRHPALPPNHHLSAQVMHRLSRAGWRRRDERH